MKPKPTAAKMAQPTPRDIREVVDGLAASAELDAPATLAAPAGLIASRGLISSEALAVPAGLVGFGANDMAARITPVSVTAIPIPRSALIRSPLAMERAT